VPYSPQNRVASGYNRRHLQVMVRRYENPEQSVTDNNRHGVLHQAGSSKKRTQTVIVKNLYVTNVTFGLDNGGPFERP
jgi:hypothetical protein